MLLPHHYVQQMCQHCGRLPAFATAFCPSCGAALILPRPYQSSRPNTIVLSPLAVPPSQSSNHIPLIVEIPLNVLGIYGVGWLILGNITTGLMLLVGSLILWPVVILLSIFTMGLGLICLGPLALAAMIANLLLLQRAIKLDALEKQRQEGTVLEEFAFSLGPDLSFPTW